MMSGERDDFFFSSRRRHTRFDCDWSSDVCSSDLMRPARAGRPHMGGVTRDEPYDAIVVGSGITGGWAAKELCEKGLRTLVLERGRHVEHGKDYVTEWWQPWQLAHRGRGEERLYERDYPIQSKNYAFGEATRHFFVNDREHPYVTPDDKPFRWIRGYQLGGRSLIWGRACWRGGGLDFTAHPRDGPRVDLPVPDKDLEALDALLGTVVTDAIVHSVIYDERTDRATGVRVIDANTKATTEYSGRLIFLCASTLGTAQILLSSRSARFPTGLANSSGELGHNLMDHISKAGARGTVPGLEDKYVYGRRPTGSYIPRFRNLGVPGEAKVGFLRGYGIQGGAGRQGWGRGADAPGLGVELKQRLREPGPWGISLQGYGECLPRHENYVDLDPQRTDQWGIPLPRVHCSWSQNERAIREDVKTQGAEMLEAAGCTNVETYDEDGPPGFSVHEMGTARMGRDPKTAVLNAHNQAHDVPNLFVTDGACMTSSSCVNPSLTYMALTARAVDYAVSELKRHNL